jgi:hypothetical protein
VTDLRAGLRDEGARLEPMGKRTALVLIVPSCAVSRQPEEPSSLVASTLAGCPKAG